MEGGLRVPGDLGDLARGALSAPLSNVPVHARPVVPRGEQLLGSTGCGVREAVETVKDGMPEAGRDERLRPVEGEVANEVDLVHLDGSEVEAGGRRCHPVEEVKILQLLGGQALEADDLGGDCVDGAAGETVRDDIVLAWQVDQVHGELRDEG